MHHLCPTSSSSTTDSSLPTPALRPAIPRLHRQVQGILPSGKARGNADAGLASCRPAQWHALSYHSELWQWHSLPRPLHPSPAQVSANNGNTHAVEQAGPDVLAHPCFFSFRAMIGLEGAKGLWSWSWSWRFQLSLTSASLPWKAPDSKAIGSAEIDARASRRLHSIPFHSSLIPNSDA